MGGSGQQGRSTKNSMSTGLDDDALEQLINKVCTNFTQQLYKKLDSRTKKLESKLTQACESFTALNDRVSSNAKTILKIGERMDLVEQGNKRNTLRLCGLPESENEELEQLLLSFINNDLKVSCDITDLDYFFRIGPEMDDKPRTLLVRFVRNSKRNEVLGAKNLLKGSTNSLFEDLTPERYSLLQETKKKFGNNKAWSSGGKIFYWDERKNKKMMVTVGNNVFS